MNVALVRELSQAAVAFQAPDHSWSIPAPPAVASVLDRVSQYVDIDRETPQARFREVR